MRRPVMFWTLLASAGAAHASELPLYRPAPAWVKPAPPIDVARLGDDAPLLLVMDNQQRLEKGEVWNYQDIATRIASPEVLAKAGTVQLPWQPDKGDLVIHRLEIVRGAEHIDLLAAGKRFQVIRREQQLEQQSLDGQLTATMAVEGLRVGDVLRLTASVTRREAAFGDAVQGIAGLPQAPFKVGFARARFLWPVSADVKWKSYAEGAAPVLSTANGYRELTLLGPLPKAAELPDDAPVRFRKLPLMEAASFGDWPAVSRAVAPLYATDGLIKPGGDLAGRLAVIAAASPDPMKRAAAALQLVQEEVRYLYNGMAGGNYVPQPPEQTWALRYGDCKAKTLLLLAALRSLGVEAEPVLASSQMGGLVPDRLPSAGAFDHVFVTATVNGATLWLDGTGRGARLDDLRDPPPLGWVLPLRVAGAAPVELPRRAPARPSTVVTLDYDQRAGVNFPSLVTASLTVHGAAAEMVSLAKSQGSKEQQQQFVQQIVSKAVGRDVYVADYTLGYSAADAEATVTATALLSSWSKRDDRYRLMLDKGVGNLTFEPDRARAAWAAIPVATGAPDTTLYRTRVSLPDGGKGFTLEGDQIVGKPLASVTVIRKASLAGALLSVEERVEESGADIAPADIAATRAAVAQARTRLLEGVAPAETAPRWRVAADARAHGRFQPLLDAYTRAVTAHPDEAEPYLNRANFLVGIYDYKAALGDYDKVLAIEPSASLYRQRADLFVRTGAPTKAVADWRAALKLDPADTAAQWELAEWQAQNGQGEAALAAVQERVDAGGSGRPTMLSLKATVLGWMGRKDEALTAMDQAIAAKPGDPALLNSRCWLKGTLNVQLDSALKDCTKAIELAESPSAILDSRALVYFRLDRPDDALADLASALEAAPDQAGSLYLEGVIRTRTHHAAAQADLDAARLIRPDITQQYQRFGVTP